MFLSSKPKGSSEQNPEEVRRMREATCAIPECPECDKTWEGTVQGVRVNIRCWNSERSTARNPTRVEDKFIGALIRSCHSHEESADGVMERCTLEPAIRREPMHKTMAAGEHLIARLEAGIEVRIETATHTAKCYIPNTKWVAIGMATTEDRRAVQFGVESGFEVTVQGQVPDIHWIYNERAPARAPMAHPRATPTSARDNEPAGTDVEILDTTINVTGEGGPTWSPPANIGDWLADVLAKADQGQDNSEDPDCAMRDEETELAEEVLLTYCPTPSPTRVKRLTNWLRQHAQSVRGGPSPEPKRWMWEFVLYAWALEDAGIAELRQSDPARQEDLIGQLDLPAWVKNAFPVTPWCKGQRSMKPGKGYIEFLHS